MGQWFRVSQEVQRDEREGWRKGYDIVCFLKRDFFLKGKGGEKTNINQFLAHFE